MLEYVDKVARTPLSQILIFAGVLTVLRVVAYVVTNKTPKHKRGFGVSLLNGASDFSDSLIYAAVFIFMVIRPYFFQTFQIPSGSLHPTLQVGDFIGLNKAIYRYTEPKRGDLVVFHPPAIACLPEQLREDGTARIDFVKRLIGLPGDLVEIRSGKVYINNKPLYEPYWHYSSQVPEAPGFKLFTLDETRSFPKASWKLVNYKGQLTPLNYTETDANSLYNHPPSYATVDKFAISDPAEFSIVKALPAQKIPAGHYLFMGDNRNNSLDGRAWGLIDRDSIIGRAEFVWMPFSRIGIPHYVPNGTEKAPDAIVPEGMK